MYCSCNAFATGLLFMVKYHQHEVSVCQKNGSCIVHAFLYHYSQDLAQKRGSSESRKEHTSIYIKQRNS